MDPFLILGVIGLGLIGSSLVAGDILDGLFDAVDLGSGLFSAPVVGGFLAAFGFAAAVAGPVVGVVAGLALGAVTALLTRSLLHMRTDPTPRPADLVGRPGVVLSAVPAGGFGRVRVAAHGQQLQLHATSDRPLVAGTRIVVVEVSSPTAVVVSPLDLEV